MRCGTLIALLSGTLFASVTATTGKQSLTDKAAAVGMVEGNGAIYGNEIVQQAQERDSEPDDYYVDCNSTAGDAYADYTTTLTYIESVCNSLNGVTISEQTNMGKLLTSSVEISLMAFPNCSQTFNGSECLYSYMSLLWDCGGADGGQAASGEIDYWGGCYVDYWLSIYTRSKVAAANATNATQSSNGTIVERIADLEAKDSCAEKRQESFVTDVTSTSTSTEYSTVTVYRATTVTSVNATIIPGASIVVRFSTTIAGNMSATKPGKSSAQITATASSYVSVCHNISGMPSYIAAGCTQGHPIPATMSEVNLTGPQSTTPTAINTGLSKRDSANQTTMWVLIAVVLFLGANFVI